MKARTPRTIWRIVIDDQKSSSESGNGSRWWDLYVLRYTVGTVFGAVIVELLSRKSSAVRALVPIFNIEQVKWEQLVLLAVFGFVYCLIASAPILVAHATRYLIDFGDPKMDRDTLCRAIKALLIPSIVGILIYLTQPPGHAGFLGAISFVWALIMLLQLVALWRAFSDSHQQFQFYELLSRRRAMASGDFLNSYRHLREHGNSFLIVILEITMGMMLYAASILFPSNPGEQDPVALFIAPSIFILFWVFPAASVWLVGTGLERHFAFGQKK